MFAELPPSIEEPYRLIYFVVTDQMRTTIAVLRAVLKEGLDAPSRLPKALIIDQLHTLEVFRKQGLATSLINFVKGIAGAHEIELYASCGMWQRSFWEIRGFEEETNVEMLGACSCVDDLMTTSVLLRAGAGYTEYQPANGERLSITRPFDLNSVCDDAHTRPLSGSGSKPSGQGAGEDYGGAGGGAYAGSAAPATATADGRRLTDERLARHDEEEEAKRLAISAPDAVDAGIAGAGVSTAVGGAMLTAESETAAAAAALTATRGGSSFLAQRATVGGWPGVGVGPAAAAAVAQTSSGFNATVGGFLGWTPSNRAIGSATAGAGAGAEAVAAAEAVDKRAMAARGLLAIPSSAGHGGDVVDLTEGIGGRTLAEQDEEQMQLAIAMSLSAAETSGAGAGGGGGGGDGERGSNRPPPGDDTETEEDVDYGAQLSGGNVDTDADADADTADRGGSPRRKRTEADSSGSESASSGRAEAGVDVVRNDGSRRIRRRRDENGASTSGEQSPSGADGCTANGAGIELEDSGVTPKSSSARGAPLNAAARGDVSSFRRAGTLGVSDTNARGPGGSSRAGAAAGGHRGTGTPANVCVAAATGVADENDSGPAAPPPGSNANSVPCSPAALLPSSSPPSPCPSSSSSCSFSLEPGSERRRAARAAKKLAATAAAESKDHRYPSRVSMSNKGDDGMVAYHRHSAAQVSPRGQEEQQQRQQLQVSTPGDEGGMISVLGGAPPPPPAGASSATKVTEAAGLGAGGGGDLGPGGGFISDDLGANDMLLRDFGVTPGVLDEKLITVAGWHTDDNDEELRRVMEASRQSHEAEMLQRATQESQEAAAAAATASAAEAHPPHPSSWPHSSSSTPRASNASGGGPDVAVLPPFGPAEPPRDLAGHASGTAHPGTGGGSGAGGLHAGGGGAPWMETGGWDDGEVMSFAGNGKGKGRCRD
eukprot:g7655.t1